MLSIIEWVFWDIKDLISSQDSLGLLQRVIAMADYACFTTDKLVSHSRKMYENPTANIYIGMALCFQSGKIPTLSVMKNDNLLYFYMFESVCKLQVQRGRLITYNPFHKKYDSCIKVFR